MGRSSIILYSATYSLSKNADAVLKSRNKTTMTRINCQQSIQSTINPQKISCKCEKLKYMYILPPSILNEVCGNEANDDE